MLDYVLGSPPPLWGQGSLPLLPACSPCSQLASLTPSSLPLLRAHSPCFQLTPLAPNGLSGGMGAREGKGYVILCFGVPTTSVGTRLTPLAPSLLPLLPACFPHSQLALPCSQLTPLLPAPLPLFPMDQAEAWGQGRGRGMLYYVLGSPPPLWGQGAREQAGR